MDKVDIIKHVEKGKLTGLSGRCLSLVKLFWPEDWKKYSLNGDIDDKKVITHDDNSAMAGKESITLMFVNNVLH